MRRTSTGRRLLFAVALLAAAIAAPGAVSLADTGTDADPGVVTMRMLRKHDKKVTRELRQIKREIAALRQSQEEPGVREIMGGIGYILGLCGVAALAAGRRRSKD